MRTTWETRDAAKLLGTNARRLMGWTEKGLMTPTVAGGGKGSRRLYTLVDLVEGVVSFSEDEHCWVAAIDWAAIRHVSDRQAAHVKGIGSSSASPVVESGRT